MLFAPAKYAREFPKHGKWYWLHSDNIVNCDIDPLTGIVTTPTDLRVQGDQRIADRHVELEAEKIDAAKREQAAREERINQEARERAARDEAAKRERQEAARKSREKREVEAEFYRQIKAAGTEKPSAKSSFESRSAWGFPCLPHLHRSPGRGRCPVGAVGMEVFRETNADVVAVRRIGNDQVRRYR